MTVAAEALEAKGTPKEVSQKLAAVDVFVEKAQVMIEKRARKYMIWGVVTAALAIGTLITAGMLIYIASFSDLVKHLGLQERTSIGISAGYIFSAWILKSTTFAALLGSAVYFLVMLSRALLHEASVLYSRRHALRFGRVFVYLKDANIKNFDELNKAFRWNEDFASAFKDIQGDKVGKTLAQKALELVFDLAKTTPQLLDELNKLRKPK